MHGFHWQWLTVASIQSSKVTQSLLSNCMMAHNISDVPERCVCVCVFRIGIIRISKTMNKLILSLAFIQIVSINWTKKSKFKSCTIDKIYYIICVRVLRFQYIVLRPPSSAHVSLFSWNNLQILPNSFQSFPELAMPSFHDGRRKNAAGNAGFGLFQLWIFYCCCRQIKSMQLSIVFILCRYVAFSVLDLWPAAKSVDHGHISNSFPSSSSSHIQILIYNQIQLI